jgi:hypothetical protein
MVKQLTAVVALVLLVFMFAFSIPSMQAATESPSDVRLDLDEGETATVTEGLTVTADATSNTEATVTFEDVETGADNTTTVPEGNTSNWSLPGGNGTVTNVDSTANQVTVEIEYPTAYGWNPAGVAIVNNIGLILVIMAFVVIMGAMIVVVRG